MGKKRKCRLTAEELEIHETAVKLRKMSDAQLVAEYRVSYGKRRLAEKAALLAQEEAEQQNTLKNTNGVKKLLNALSDGKCEAVTQECAEAIRQLAREMRLIA